MLCSSTQGRGSATRRTDVDVFPPKTGSSNIRASVLKAGLQGSGPASASAPGNSGVRIGGACRGRDAEDLTWGGAYSQRASGQAASTRRWALSPRLCLEDVAGLQHGCRFDTGRMDIRARQCC